MSQLQELQPCDSPLSQAANMPLELVSVPPDSDRSTLPSFDEARTQFIRSYLAQVLQLTGGNVSEAARLAKRNRTDFYKILQRYLLVPSDFKVYPT
jgi:two-component system, NtrC family, response regulator GlrR